MKKDYDFIVGFTLFNPSGFKTRFRHFDNLKVAEMFCENRNLKNNSKIYVDYDYFKEEIDKLKNYYEKEKEKNKNARERIEYYLVENMRLNDFDERNKELKKLEKVLEE